MLYALGIGALIVALSGGWAWIQGKRLETAKAELAVCSAAYNQALTSIQKQNKAVAELEKASKQAQERARIAKAALEGSRQANTKEIARLKGEALKKPVTTCPAGEGVKVVRDGLK